MAYRYKTVKRGGKTVLLHRWLMAQKLGRALLPSEEVHHVNEDKFDNRIENLELKTSEAHAAHHHPPIHPTKKTCRVCKRVFVPHKTKRKRNKTCSHSCGLALAFGGRYGWPRARMLAYAASGAGRA